MEKLDPPVELEGEMQTERVATVTWEGGKIAPGEFDEFGTQRQGAGRARPDARLPRQSDVLER